MHVVHTAPVSDDLIVATPAAELETPAEEVIVRKRKRGRPRGKTQNTIEKEAAAEALRQMVLTNMRPLVERQMANSMGVGHMYTRDKHGRYTRIENEEQVWQMLQTGTEGEHFWIFTKDPSVSAFTDLMNRALGKPVEAQEVKHSGGLTVKWQD
jgi:hypothetical protein